MSTSSLGPVTQIGIIVNDIEAAVQAWAAVLGVPAPDIMITDPVERAHTEYQGQPSTARAKLAFFHAGQVDIELIEPIGEPSTWRDQLNEHGMSLHHVAFQIQGMKEQIAALGALGLPLVQKGDYEGGRYAYVDATGPLGAVIELLEND